LRTYTTNRGLDCRRGYSIGNPRSRLDCMHIDMSHNLSTWTWHNHLAKHWKPPKTPLAYALQGINMGPLTQCHYRSLSLRFSVSVGRYRDTVDSLSCETPFVFISSLAIRWILSNLPLTEIISKHRNSSRWTCVVEFIASL